MAMSPALKASARSAYRDLLRASALTFAGDDVVLKAFRAKMRMDALVFQAETDATVYESQTILAKEIATVLRRNIVQAVKVGKGDNEKDTWKLRITTETELGSNETIKYPPLVEPSRHLRKKEKDAQQSASGQFPSAEAARHNSPSSNVFRYYSALKRAHKQRIVPELKEEDLEESFVRGSGPGGQSINKTENNVQLLHKPTGIRVSCQETRSLALNRRLARRLIIEKLDKIQNPGLSKGELQKAKQRERERRRRKKAKKKTQGVRRDHSI